MFLYSLWLRLDLPTRNRIASEFGIVKKNSTHVQDNRVISDGFLIEDVETALSLENLQRILQTNNTDIAILWDMLVNSTPVPKELLPKVEVAPEQPIKKITKKKNAKTKK